MNSISIHSQRVKQAGHLELLAKQVVEGFITGLHKSPFHGFSVEFAEHRLYNSGESTRHIDWKLYARTEKLFVKRYEEETNLRCQVVIDNSSSMQFPPEQNRSQLEVNKVGFATYAAASIIHLLKRQRDAFGLTLFSDKIDIHTEAHSTSVHSKLIFHQLEQLLSQRPLQEQRKTSCADALHEIADKISRRSLVIIFSDMMERSDRDGKELWSALQHLRHNKHDVILFHVMDRRSECEFDFESRPYRFVDMETGEELRLNPAEVRDAYRSSIEEFEHLLKLKCAQYSIDLVQADIEKGFDQVLMPYLIKRKKMF